MICRFSEVPITLIDVVGFLKSHKSNILLKYRGAWSVKTLKSLHSLSRS